MDSIVPEALTAEAFAPFGEVIECDVGRAQTINAGTCVKFADLARLELDRDGGRAAMHIYRAIPLQAPIVVRRLERHALGTQAFFPIDNRPYLVVVAPAGLLDIGRIKVFRATGNQGVNYRQGTWHHFCLALEQESRFLVVDRCSPEADCDEIELPAAQQFLIKI
jgi:ureidoglycolate lyase